MARARLNTMTKDRALMSIDDIRLLSAANKMINGVISRWDKHYISKRYGGKDGKNTEAK